MTSMRALLLIALLGVAAALATGAAEPVAPKADAPKEENPVEVADKARKYQAEQKILGHTISAADAVAFVTKEI